jgi:NAD(P)-dependent dehydrogenase (short-subunit alcohol dehydrogenase family)
VVTGGGRGLGRAIALELAGGGADVAVLARSAAEVETVADEARVCGARALALKVDVTSTREVEAARDAITDQLGPVGVVVNNAGAVLYKPFVPLPGRPPALPGWEEPISDQEWDGMLAVNLGGAVRMLRAFGPGLIERRYGRVVNVASNVVRRTVPFNVSYDTAKAGLIQLTRSLAREWGHYGVTVNAVAAGHFETAMTRPQFDHPETMRKMLRRVPAGRVGEHSELAALVAFLAAGTSGFITGETIGIDGGETL